MKTGDIDTRLRRRVEKLALVALAGQIAQARFRRTSLHSWHHETDYTNAYDLVSYLAQSDCETKAWLKLLYVRAKQMIDLHWQAVQGLARNLVSRKVLSGKEARDILARATVSYKMKASPR
ncbi:MAG: hypothetical protein ABSD31_12610 [Candidatus Binataceae bacterium]